MVKLSASEMVSTKSVICGDAMQLVHILLAPAFINSVNVVTNQRISPPIRSVISTYMI
jgi:hypothetical protein